MQKGQFVPSATQITEPLAVIATNAITVVINTVLFPKQYK